MPINMATIRVRQSVPQYCLKKHRHCILDDSFSVDIMTMLFQLIQSDKMAVFYGLLGMLLVIFQALTALYGVDNRSCTQCIEFYAWNAIPLRYSSLFTL